MVTWDDTVDLLIVGSGGGGMVAALAAVDSGIEPLIVEKQSLIGGSTGMSGGMVWLPDNPLMRADGIPDSHADGLAYFDDVVGDVGPASSRARREMFLTAGAQRVRSDTETTGGATGRAAPSRESRSTPPHSATGALAFNRPWRRTTGSCSRPTRCARCSTSTGPLARSPWPRECSCAPGPLGSGVVTCSPTVLR